MKLIAKQLLLANILLFSIMGTIQSCYVDVKSPNEHNEFKSIYVSEDGYSASVYVSFEVVSDSSYAFIHKSLDSYFSNKFESRYMYDIESDYKVIDLELRDYFRGIRIRFRGVEMNPSPVYFDDKLNGRVHSVLSNFLKTKKHLDNLN